MAAQRIKGVLSPVVTPFKRDLSPDVGRFIAHCKWLLSQDCGLAVFGTNSEANSMSADERMGLLEAAIAGGVPTDRMMPGTGACSIVEAAKVSAHATRLGVAGVLMLPPFYYKGVPEEGLFRFFSEVVQRVGDDRLRVYLYHIPPVSAVPITHKLVERLMKAYPKQIAGMKDSSDDWPHTKSMIAAFAKGPDSPNERASAASTAPASADSTGVAPPSTVPSASGSAASNDSSPIELGDTPPPTATPAGTETPTAAASTPARKAPVTTKTTRAPRPGAAPAKSGSQHITSQPRY